jgi:hypothetical protein
MHLLVTVKKIHRGEKQNKWTTQIVYLQQPFERCNNLQQPFEPSASIKER